MGNDTNPDVHEPENVEKINDLHSDIPSHNEEEENHGSDTPPSDDKEDHDREYPAMIRVAQHFGFYGEDDVLYQWHEGQIISNADVIGELIDRGIKYKEVTE